MTSRRERRRRRLPVTRRRRTPPSPITTPATTATDSATGGRHQPPSSLLARGLQRELPSADERSELLVVRSDDREYLFRRHGGTRARRSGRRLTSLVPTVTVAVHVFFASKCEFIECLFQARWRQSRTGKVSAQADLLGAHCDCGGPYVFASKASSCCNLLY